MKRLTQHLKHILLIAGTLSVAACGAYDGSDQIDRQGEEAVTRNGVEYELLPQHVSGEVSDVVVVPAGRYYFFGPVPERVIVTLRDARVSIADDAAGTYDLVLAYGPDSTPMYRLLLSEGSSTTFNGITLDEIKQARHQDTPMRIAVEGQGYGFRYDDGWHVGHMSGDQINLVTPAAESDLPPQTAVFTEVEWRAIPLPGVYTHYMHRRTLNGASHGFVHPAGPVSYVAIDAWASNGGESIPAQLKISAHELGINAGVAIPLIDEEVSLLGREKVAELGAEDHHSYKFYQLCDPREFPFDPDTHYMTVGIQNGQYSGSPSISSLRLFSGELPEGYQFANACP